MHPSLQPYKILVDFMSAVLGPHTEIVLHDLTQGFDHSVVHIQNNFSGRTIGSPATDFILDVHHRQLYQTQDYMVNYQTKTLSGRPCRSSSFFIKDERGQLIGMICTNTDQSYALDLQALFEKGLTLINQTLGEKRETFSSNETIEHFYISAENMIEEAILNRHQGNEGTQAKLSKNDKIAIVRELHQKGFFDFKDAVSKVATAFQMSEVSIYKYLQTVKHEEKSSSQ